MSHGNQSYLRFSLEESVWFQKGQEVDELVSISLDPIITIKESDQYVTIKGSLELSGEYNRDQLDAEEVEYFANPKLIQTVEVREEGVHLFSHLFPVEITIPKNRIEDLNDIQVTVETFDYAFPEKSCLRLSADLMITGLYGEQQHELIQDDYPEPISYEFEPAYRESILPEEDYDERKNPFAKPQYTDEESSEIFKPFEVAARKNPQAEIQDDYQAEDAEQEEANLDKANQSEYLYERKDVNPTVTKHTYSEEPEYPEPEVIFRETEQENPREEETEPASLPEIVFSSKRSEEPQKPASPVLEEKVEEITEGLDEKTEAPEKVKTLEMEEMLDEIEEEDSPSDDTDKKKSKKWKNKQSLTLSEFFARKAEEEHTRVTMCIVQNGETLDLISERYEVPVAQIQRVNQMELNQDIYEGQVLYIPIAQTQR
ncbi:stage VI sporulation protein D [Bacillus tuaregi]|uniref:stage VI sporulation protein D n=1 Tax=Bacillus tuaregi TaxID=1816695 RepID=UPI0008F95938|nr:stage VI sporulation protein D [Bacillus tuaregi]